MPDIPPEDAAELHNIATMVDAQTADGKYFFLEVPDFDTDKVGNKPKNEDTDTAAYVGDRKGEQMTSFMRLGVFPLESSENEAVKRSWELAKVALAVSSGQGGPLNADYGGDVDVSNTGVGMAEPPPDPSATPIVPDLNWRTTIGDSAPPADNDAAGVKKWRAAVKGIEAEELAAAKALDAKRAARKEALFAANAALPADKKLDAADIAKQVMAELPDPAPVEDTIKDKINEWYETFAETLKTVDRGVFLDDQRVADVPLGATDGDAGSRPRADMLAQSKGLLTRGGWWDHTDGNRVSTTYGDKVEVIRGNYKMVVMHRQDDPGSAGGWDVSGGHVQDLGPASMPGASVRVEFRPGMFGQRGTWHLENQTFNFIQTSDYAGDFFEHWYGNIKNATVGSENPVEWHHELEKPYGNPEIIEKTWAKKIESYTGSVAWRIPSIHEETYALEMSAKTDVTGSIRETTLCDGVMSASTGSLARPVKRIEETTYATSTDTKTFVGASNDFTTVGIAMETTMATTLGSLTIAVDQTEVEVLAAKNGVSLVLTTNEFSMGFERSLSIGNRTTFQIGPHEDVTMTKQQLYANTVEVAINRTNTALAAVRTAITNTTTSISNSTTALSNRIAGLMNSFGI